MKATILYILILIAEIGYGQQNMLLDGNFEMAVTNTCEAVNPGLQQTNGSSAIDLIGLSVSNFNTTGKWRVAPHDRDASDEASDEVGEQLLIDFSQCFNSGFFNDKVHSCAGFPTINGSGTKFALIASNYISCSSSPGKTHGAIGNVLPNGNTFPNATTFIIRYKIVPTGGRNLDLNGGNFCSADNNGGLFCHIRFFLSENPPSTWDDSQSDHEELLSVNYQEQLTPILPINLAACEWRQVEKEFTTLQGNYTSLIIYCESGGAAIDDVEIFQKCENTKLIQNKSYSYATGGFSGMGFNTNEQAGTDLIAGHNITSAMPQGDVIVGPQTKANFTAGNSINLLPGFSAEYQSTFAAVPLGCPNSLNRMMHAEEEEDPNSNPIPLTMKSDQKPRIFPNPANTSFTYQTDRAFGNSRFVMTNVMGEVFAERKVTESTNEVSFDISQLPAGIYFLNRYGENKMLLSTNKIIKE